MTWFGLNNFINCARDRMWWKKIACVLKDATIYGTKIRAEFLIWNYFLLCKEMCWLSKISGGNIEFGRIIRCTKSLLFTLNRINKIRVLLIYVKLAQTCLRQYWNSTRKCMIADIDKIIYTVELIYGQISVNLMEKK